MAEWVEGYCCLIMSLLYGYLLFLSWLFFCGNLVKSFCPFIEVFRCVLMNYYEFLQLFFTYRSMQS